MVAMRLAADLSMWHECSGIFTVCFSPYLPIALVIFVLAIIGIVSLIRQNWREGAVLLAFPLFYLLYFAMQRVMVVRNLLAVIPFLAIAAARGAVVIGELLRRKNAGHTTAPRKLVVSGMDWTSCRGDYVSTHGG